MSRKSWLAVVLAGTLLQGAVFAQTPLPAAPPPPGVLTVGNFLVLPESKIRLNEIIRPGDPISISPLTEYNYTLTNTTPDQEVTFQSGGITVGGEVRRPSGDVKEILAMNDGNRAAQTAGAGVVGGVLGLLGAFLGPVASVATHVGVNTAVAHTMYDTPLARLNELKKRLFQTAQGDAVVLLPGESATGSTWIRQSKDEPATLVQLFIKPGNGSRRLVQLPLADTPTPVVVTPESAPVVPPLTADTVSKQ
ncbi:MAG: hypothetical protein Q7K57_07275 [Burkholderiaceae bacterium]|nr:hypothetical protein [Burkholderiaceae bacterium]